MFTVFNREVLLSEVRMLQSQTTQKKRNFTTQQTTFISEGDLPERVSLILKKFDDGHFMFKQSRHIIDLTKGQMLLDKFISEDITDVSGVLVNLFEQLNTNKYDKYRTKTGNLMIPCLTDIEYHCPLCNLLQTMRTISSYNLDNLNQLSEYYEIVEMIHKVADLISQTFFRIENYVIVGLVFDEQLKVGDVKILTTSHKFFNKFTSSIASHMKENGVLLSDIDYIKAKIVGQPTDKFTYEVQDITEIEYDENVKEFCSNVGIYEIFMSYVNEWSKNRVKSTLYKRTLSQVSDIESDFTELVDSTADLLLEVLKDRLSMLQ